MMDIDSVRGMFRLRFSLKALLIALTLFVVWLAFHTERAARQRVAANQIAQLDGFAEGFIAYRSDWDMSAPGIPRRKSPTSVNRWLRMAVGDDFVEPITYIAAPGAKDDLSFLRSLPDLQALTLEQSQITDDSIKQIVHLKQLRYLWLDQTQITDSCVDDLSQLRQLRELYVRQTQLTRQGATRLQTRLPNCNVHWRGP